MATTSANQMTITTDDSILSVDEESTSDEDEMERSADDECNKSDSGDISDIYTHSCFFK